MKEVLKSRRVAFILGAALTAGIFKFGDSFPAYTPAGQTIEVHLPRGRLLNLRSEPYNYGTVQGSILKVVFGSNSQPLEVKNFRSEYIDSKNIPQDDPRYGKVTLRRYTNAPTYAEDMTNLMLLRSKSSEWIEMSAPSYFEPSVFLTPQEIKTGFVVPVWGDAYESPWGFGTNASFGNKDAVFNGVLLNGGVWYTLADGKGKLVGPDGKALGQNEKPYFIQGYNVALKNDIAEYH